ASKFEDPAPPIDDPHRSRPEGKSAGAREPRSSHHDTTRATISSPQIWRRSGGLRLHGVLPMEVIRSGVLWAQPDLPSGDTHLGGPARSPSEAMSAPGR